MELVEKLNRELVNYLKERGFLVTKSVEKAFLEVRRHYFTPEIWEFGENGKWTRYKLNYKSPDEDLLRKIYKDTSLNLMVEDGKVITTSSQPAVMAVMMEGVGLDKGDRVMEIGTGSGYNIGVMSKVVGNSGIAVSIEVNPGVYGFAKENLERAGIRNVHLWLGDGTFGLEKYAPYDKIVVTAATPVISDNWIAQMRIGGKLVLPLVVRGLEILVFMEKKEEGILEGQGRYYVRFLSFKGPGSVIYRDLPPVSVLPLETVLRTSAIRDRELESVINTLTIKERHDLFLYLALMEKHATSFATEVGEFEWGYGIWKDGVKKSGFVFVFGDRVYTWGDRNARLMFFKLFEQWNDLGKPKIGDYKIKVVPRGYLPLAKDAIVFKGMRLCVIFERT